MKFIYFIATVAFCILFSLSSSAQKNPGSVKGSLMDSVSGQMLYDATVSIVRVKDSTLISFTLTSNSGFFEVKNLAPGEYKLVVSYTGFRTLRKEFAVTAEQPTADLGKVIMERSYKTLDEVVVKDDAPVKIKGDTLAFNADAFKTKPNAVAEDLLKKLPGVTVDKDGTVKAQGETVQKVYVDGKEFFGSDPKLATKNIGADMISEVEVYDDMSEQAKFSKIDDGSRAKAINLKLKKEKKHGIFGQVYAGYGSDDRYNSNLRTNFFKGATQVSVIGNANNINRSGFTTTDFLGMGSMGGGNMTGGGSGPMIMSGSRGGGMTMSMGGGSSSGIGGGSSGVSSIYSGGVNYNDTWNRYWDESSGYNFNRTVTDNLKSTYRTTFLSDSNINRNQDVVSRYINNVHRGNAKLVYTIDENNSLIYSTNISSQSSESIKNDTVASFTEKKTGTYKLSDSRSSIINEGSGVNWNNNLLWRKRFQKAGRTLSVNFNYVMGRSDLNGVNISTLADYNPSGVKVKDSLFNQNNKRKNETDYYGVGVSYTEPIGRDKIWEMNYSYNRNTSESDRETYDYNLATKSYDRLNSELTNHFDNLNQYHRVGTNLRVLKKRYNYQVGASLQRTDLVSNDFTEKSSFDQSYTNLLTNASFNYQFARSKNLRFNYRGRTNQPTISQLQPLKDVSNPTYITEGNPDLGQEFVNNFSLTYNVFDPIRFRNLFAAISFSNTYNKIVNSTQQLDFGRQITKPENIDGVYSINANVNAGLPINNMKGGNFNMTSRIGFSRDANYVNGKKNYIKNLTLGEDLRLNYNYKEKLDLGVSGGITYTSARYSIQPQQNSSYFTHLYSVDATWVLPHGFILASDVDFTANTGRSDGYNQSFTMWNASFAKQIFRNKKGEIKVSVNDILDQNTSISRNVGDNYVEDVQSNVLKRFFMFTFTYNINRMGGKNLPASKMNMTVDKTMIQ